MRSKILVARSFSRPSFDRPFEELLPPLGDDLDLLLRDRLDAGVRLGKLDPPQPVEDSHDLFLVDHDPVGLSQDVFHDWVFVLGLLSASLDVDVFVDHPAVERTGPVKGEDGDEVGEAVGLHLDEEVADARAVELEQALWPRPSGAGRRWLRRPAGAGSGRWARPDSGR